MKKKILAVSLLSIFAFSFVVAGASAETRAEKKIREAREKVEKRVEKKITNRMATSTNATSTSSNSSSMDLNCLKNEVVARENSIIAIFAGFASNMTNAHQTRLTDLSSALSGGKTTVKEAWSKFKVSSKSARKTWKDSNKEAWTKFESRVKDCKSGGGKGVSEENEGKGIDVSVSN